MPNLIYHFWELAGYEVSEHLRLEYSIPGYGGNVWYVRKDNPYIQFKIAYKDNNIMTYIFNDKEYSEEQALRLIKLKAFL